jgi:hypothetical protein
MVKIFGRIGCVLTLVLFSVSSFAASDLRNSGKNDITDNPFIAYGVNPITQVVTGYLVALRTSPGRTDECKFVFSGNLKDASRFKMKYLSEFDGYGPGGSISQGVVKSAAGNLFMEIKKDRLGGDCEWILPFISEPRVKENADQIAIDFGKLSFGDWTGVFSIRSERARFHRAPDESSVQNVFLVQGDLIYVYQETPDWYFVKYSGRKRDSIGWIKKSDTVQIGK